MNGVHGDRGSLHMNSTCLYQYEQPVSPNIAAANSTQVGLLPESL